MGIPKICRLFLMAKGSEAVELAGKCQQVFVAAIFTLHMDKSIVLIHLICAAAPSSCDYLGFLILRISLLHWLKKRFDFSLGMHFGNFRCTLFG
jgi:hypothetical protein